MIDNEFYKKVDRFWSSDATNIRCVREEDYDSLQNQLDALELSRRSWMDEAKSLEAKVAELESVARADQARIGFRMENQRITPARFKCLACGDYHEGSGNLPCPNMRAYSVLSGGRKAGKSHLAAQLESLAKQIYQSWESQPGFHPWVDGGNSLKQNEARQIASRTFELALANQVQE